MEDRFSKLVREWTGDSQASKRVVGEVIFRISRASPEPVARVDVARGGNLRDGLARLNEGAVSRAVTALIAKHVIKEVPTSTGRPRFGLVMSDSDYRSIGIHLDSHAGRLAGLTGVVIGLAGNMLASHCVPLDIDARQSQEAQVQRVVDAVSKLVEYLRGAALPGQPKAKAAAPGSDKPPHVLGVGVTVGGHVFGGAVVNCVNGGWEGVDLANLLEKKLVDLAVVLENDVNALAIWEMHRRRLPERDFALVAVLPDGVGGALVVRGVPYRGGQGMAGEIGHLAVEYPTPKAKTRGLKDSLLKFSDQCLSSCPGYGHVDCLATPARISGELNGADFEASALASAVDARTGAATVEAAVFERAGTALGRAIAHLINVVNPARIVLLVPDALAAPPPKSAGEAYIKAMEQAVSTAFSSGARAARGGRGELTRYALSDISDQGDGATADTPDLVIARAAAVSVLDAFLAIAGGKSRLRTPAS